MRGDQTRYNLITAPPNLVTSGYHKPRGSNSTERQYFYREGVIARSQQVRLFTGVKLKHEAEIWAGSSSDAPQTCIM